MGTRTLIAALGTAAVVATSAGAGLAQASAAGGEARAGASGRHTARAVASASRVVTLPTGDRITVGATPSGAPVFAADAGLQARSLRLGGGQYVFPRSVDTVLGSVLDPELFNLTAITKNSGRIPVTVTYADPSSPTPVAGVEITSRSGLTGRGYVTAASSRALGRSLATTPAATLLANVTGVRGAVTSTPARYPMHTLTLRAVGRDGKPLPDALITYINTADPSRAVGMAYAHLGVAKVSVPTGTYELATDAPSADWTSFSIARTPEFRVVGPRSATVDLRTATTLLTTRVTAPTVEPQDVTEVSRDFPTYSIGVAVLGTTAVRLSPASAPAHGTLTVTRSEVASAPSGMADGRYTLYFRHAGAIPPTRLTLTQRASDLARVTDTFFTPATGRTLFMRTVLPKGGGGWSLGLPIDAPGTTREFLTAGADFTTRADLIVAVDPITFDALGEIESEWRDIPLAQVRAEEWNRGPVHATSFDDRDLWNGEPIRCDWCVRGDQLVLATLSGGDTDPWHVPYPMRLADGSSNVRWSVAADGRAVASGTDFLGVAGAVTLPARAGVVTARQTMVREAPYVTGTRSVTSWRMPLAATRPLPAGYACELGDRCRVLPFLTTAYDLPVDIGGAVLGGRRTLGITVHQAGRLVPQGISSVSVGVDYGAGSQRVPVTALGGGRYAATLAVPWRVGDRTSADLVVDVQAADGSRLTDRITDAFLLKFPTP